MAEALNTINHAHVPTAVPMVRKSQTGLARGSGTEEMKTIVPAPIVVSLFRTHGNPKDNAAKKTLGKENQEPSRPVMPKSSENEITNSNTEAKGEHATVDEVDAKMRDEL